MANADQERDAAKAASVDRDRVLAGWSAELAAELGVDGLDVDIDAILSLAGKAAHGIVRPAAPLTTFLVGFAAGRAVSNESAVHSASDAPPLSTEAAVEAATATALSLLARQTDARLSESPAAAASTAGAAGADSAAGTAATPAATAGDFE